MFLMSPCSHFHDSAEDLIIKGGSRGAEVLGEVCCKVVRVEASEEPGHAREDVVFEHAPEAEWSEEVAQELILTH